jgi:anti-sigma B factor antagonist
MKQDPLIIEDSVSNGVRILRLIGPLLIATLFDFQSRVRSNTSPSLILDFTNVPYVDSAGVGALVGAYVSHQKDGHSLLLVGVNQRVRNTLQVTHVDNFFQFADKVPEQAC